MPWLFELVSEVIDAALDYWRTPTPAKVPPKSRKVLLYEAELEERLRCSCGVLCSSPSEARQFRSTNPCGHRRRMRVV
jgi:hypothetical protein